MVEAALLVVVRVELAVQSSKKQNENIYYLLILLTFMASQQAFLAASESASPLVHMSGNGSWAGGAICCSAYLNWLLKFNNHFTTLCCSGVIIAQVKTDKNDEHNGGKQHHFHCGL